MASAAPRLAAPWFSLVYWRVAGIAALLTLPFLFAAAIQGVLRADLTLVLRAAFGYLPLALLAVAVAAQLAALLIAVTDELCALVSSAAGGAAPGMLARAGQTITGLTVAAGSPFLAFLIAVFTVVGALVLWIEMMIRQAAVYVIVAMLPLAFAAMVWPARRVWALRAVELLVALILSKLAVVAVLTLGGAALEQSPGASWLTGLVLLVLGLFAPWAMLRLIPFAELAAGGAGHLRAHAGAAVTAGALAGGIAEAGHDWLSATTSQMRRDARQYPAEAADLQRAQLLGGPEPEPGDANPLGGGPSGDGGPIGDGPSGVGGPAGADSPAGGGAVWGGDAPTQSVAPVDSVAPAESVPAESGGSSSAVVGSDRPDPGTSSAGVDPVDGGATPDAPRGERLPGLGPMWQAGNYEWPEMQLDSTPDWWAGTFPAEIAPEGETASSQPSEPSGEGAPE